MNTTTHAVAVPFPQAFACPKTSLFPGAPRYSSTLPDLPEMVMRSNQTARCDRCLAFQTWKCFSGCILALCERTVSIV
jgi:hypothetical protein